MRTITEFAAPTLKKAAQTKAELLSAGKTAEELPAAMGEALKLEGEKLNYLMCALEVVGEKTNDLKRVIVASLNEGEKAPSSVKQMGEQYYTVEYYPSLNRGGGKPQEGRDDRRGGRGRRGDKRGGKRGDRRGGRGGEGRGGEAGGPGAGGENKPRGPRGPRPPRGPKPVALQGEAPRSEKPEQKS